MKNLDRVVAIRYERSFCLALGIALATACGQLFAGPAVAQAFNFNPDALLPPSREELPPNTMETEVGPETGYAQSEPIRRPQRYNRREQYRNRQ